MSLEEVKIGNLICKPMLNDTFAAEVTGVDFSKPIPDETIKNMIEIQHKYAVTVYRNTGLNDQTHVRFSRQLGDLEKAPKFNSKDQPDRFSERELFDAGNMDVYGNIVQKNSRRWWYNKGNALWHTDSSFNQHRSKYSLLLAHLLPSEGGDTGYCDVRSAYRDLPEAKKQEIDGLVVKHNLWHSRKITAPEEFKNITEREMSVKPPAYHKLVQDTPNGEGKTLFIAAHAESIVGWPLEKGQALIQELLHHCAQPKYTIAVKWKQPGDLVWWDNRQSMHRATPFSDQMEKRDMRRTTVFESMEDTPNAFGVDPASLGIDGVAA